MSAARKAVDALERFPSSDCRHAKANEACDCAVDTVADLSAPLAAVVRAVADRPWETRFPGVTPLCRVCGLRTPHDPDAILTPHADWCPMIAADAALDALEAAALAQGFKP